MVKSKNILVRGVMYRAFIIVCNVCFSHLFLLWSIERLGTGGTALAWNAVNMLLYFIYHVIFANLFESEEDKKEG